MPPTSPPLTRADASSPAPAGAQDIGGAPPHERILLAARDLFCRDGIHATGIDRILQEASASKMTLYSRFGSKEALLREVLALESAEWRAAFFAAVEGASPGPAERLHAVIPALRTWFIGERFYGCAFMNAAAEHAKGKDAGTPWLREMTQEHHGAVLAFLAGLAEAAGYAEPGILARQVLLVMDGAIAAMMVGGDPAVLDISARTLRAVLAQPGA